MFDSGVRLFIGLADENVAPGGTLRGEVVVVVSSSCLEGVPYRRICLELQGEEHNNVRDDQGEFDALLDDYTSNRTYLSRHVTLSGKKTTTEDAETAAQRRQEVMFHEHHAAPYYSVTPSKMFGIPLKETQAKRQVADRSKDGCSKVEPVAGASVPGHDSSFENPQPAASIRAGLANEDNLEAVPSSGADREKCNVRPATLHHEMRNQEDNSVTVQADLEDVSLGGEEQSITRSLQRHKAAVVEAAAGGDIPSATSAPTGEAPNDTAPPSRQSHYQRLMPGRYTFPFSFRVPPWVPPSLYYSINDASGNITYTAKVHVEFPGARRNLTASQRFYVLSAISQRQLIACHEEAIDLATTSPMPPLSALFQVFSCACLGNLCCLASDSAIEVEVALQSSRALVLSDANATYQVLRNYRQERLRGSDLGTLPAPNAGGRVYNGYDAFAERQFKQAGAVDDGNSKVEAGPLKGANITLQNPSASTLLMEQRDAQREALQQRRLQVEDALPLPIGLLPLVVRVHNRCTTREIPKVRVELRETIQVFRSLEVPRMFPHPLARYDYAVAIPPGEVVTFSAHLRLPKQFRRCKENDASLLPPPGVKTANLTTTTVIVVSFPGLSTYVEEEDWVNGVVQLAEVVDMTDDVLDLPTRYS